MNYASKPQLSKIHVLLNKLGLTESKVEIVSNFSNGRTISSKLLYASEAKELIIKLAEYDPNERLKSLVFSLAYQAGIIYGSTGEDKRINAAKLNLFLKERGAVKKELNAMNYAELIKTHRQFEAVVKNINKSRDKKEADKAVFTLMDELNLITVKN